MKPNRVLYSLVVLIHLGGCGGGSSAVQPVVPAPIDPNGNVDISAAQALLETHADPVVYSSMSAIPTSGIATYEGFAYGALTNRADSLTDSIFGDLEVVANFTSVTITGEITNIVDDENELMAGRLVLGDGTLDRSVNPAEDSTIGVTVSGLLNTQSSQEISIIGRLEGDLLGSDYQAIGGEFLGSVTVGTATQDLNGGFIAER